MKSAFENIGIIGANTFSIAFANALATRVSNVKIYTDSRNIAESINNSRASYDYLPDIELEKNISAFNGMNNINSNDIVFFCSAALEVEKKLREFAQHTSTIVPVVLCIKGIDAETCSLFTKIAADILPEHPICVLSGPTIAYDMAIGKTIFMSLSSNNRNVSESISEYLTSNNLISNQLMI